MWTHSYWAKRTTRYNEVEELDVELTFKLNEILKKLTSYLIFALTLSNFVWTVSIQISISSSRTGHTIVALNKTRGHTVADIVFFFPLNKLNKLFSRVNCFNNSTDRLGNSR